MKNISLLKPSIVWWLVLPVPAILVAGLVAAAILLPQQIETNTRASAVAAARTTVGQFKTIRGYYTKNVIKKALQSKALKPSINHAGVPGTIPLPATFIHDLSKLLQKEDTSVNLYSGFPSPQPQRAQARLFPAESLGISEQESRRYVRASGKTGRQGSGPRRDGRQNGRAGLRELS